MCVVDGSIDHLTSVCPMCKVFKPTGPRCPHKREVCRNKTNHPRHDVVHLTNAEVQSFNNCGYCKWAQSDPPPSKTGLHNPGWPGCCRPPQQNEVSFVQPADWLAVSVVHRVTIPPDIKALLDKVMGPAANGQLPTINTSASRTLSSNGTTTSPTSERKKRVFPTSNPVSRSPSMSIPQKVQKGGSPQMRPSSLTTSASRAPTGGSPGAVNTISSSIEASTPTQLRRPGPADTPVKRVEGFRTTPPANARKLAEADGMSTIHHTPTTRPSLANVIQLSSPSISTLADVAQRPLKRRASLSSNTSNPQAIRASKSSSKSSSSAAPSKLDSTSLESSLKSLSVSSESRSGNMSQTGGSDGSSSRGASTITSEGFTDYLSDESEAELQRQAEQRAVVAEQHRMEEEEFKAARQQLAPIGLQPPQAWTTGLPSRA